MLWRSQQEDFARALCRRMTKWCASGTTTCDNAMRLLGLSRRLTASARLENPPEVFCLGWERATAALPNGVGIAYASPLCARQWTPRPLGDACGKKMAKCLWTNRMTNGAPTMKRSVGIQVSLAMCDEEHWGEQKTSTPASILSTTGAASALLRHR